MSETQETVETQEKIVLPIELPHPTIDTQKRCPPLRTFEPGQQLVDALYRWRIEVTDDCWSEAVKILETDIYNALKKNTFGFNTYSVFKNDSNKNRFIHGNLLIACPLTRKFIRDIPNKISIPSQSDKTFDFSFLVNLDDKWNKRSTHTEVKLKYSSFDDNYVWFSLDGFDTYSQYQDWINRIHGKNTLSLMQKIMIFFLVGTPPYMFFIK